MSYHLTFCTKITTVKNSTWCHTFLIDHRENLKVHFFQGYLASPNRPRFSRAYIWKRCPQNPVSNILELLLTGLTSNPHFKTKCTAVSAMSSFCSRLPDIYYTKRINPKFATESECNHIYICVCVCVLQYTMLLSDIWSRSNFWVTCTLPECWCQ